MKKIVRSIGIIILVFSFYILWLMLGQAIPKELIMENVNTSYETLQAEGYYFSPVKGAEWDNFTDTILINSTITSYNGNLFEKALANAYTLSDQEDASIMEGLEAAISGAEGAQVQEYSRYWVGSLTLMKLLLIFMPLNDIRSLLLMLTITLFAWVCLQISRYLGKSGVASFIAAVLLGQFIPLSMCIVFGIDVVLMLGAMLVVGIFYEKGKNASWYDFLFAGIGSLCAYLNYWAFPLITLGFPLIYHLTLSLKENKSRKELMKSEIRYSLMWSIGLCGTVLAKQVLCYVTFWTKDGVKQLLVRAGSKISWKSRIYRTLLGLKKATWDDRMVMFVLLLVLVILLYALWKKKISKEFTIVPLLVIACYPVIWWFIFVEHCGHSFVLHMFGVMYYAILSMVALRIKN